MPEEKKVISRQLRAVSGCRLSKFHAGVYEGNKLNGEPKKWLKSQVFFVGKGNVFSVEQGTSFQLFKAAFRQDESSIFVGENSQVKGSVEIGGGSVLRIGRDLQTTAATSYKLAEGACITIGDDCLFAAGIQIWAHDAHPIYDLDTGERVNHSKSVAIGDHVWIGQNAIILKGVTIGHGSVVGMNSLVTSDVPENSVAAGQPARVIRSNVRWEKTNLTRQVKL